MAGFYPDRSPQFEFKLLTKFLLVYRTTSVKTLCVHIQSDCQTSAHPTRDPTPLREPEGGLHAGLESRSAVIDHPLLSNQTKNQPVTGSVQLQPENMGI
jgi:hypothetical protein